jgi:DNA repair exonuclease SbcCD nuclease subunit
MRRGIGVSETTSNYAGLLLIGDPHLEGRSPGFRRDDYPQVILDKLEWCLRYATTHRLLPALLGDVFDKPRDNPTWMLGRLIDLLNGIECLSLYGNHDCADPQLTEHDSLSLLVKCGRIRLLDGEPWTGRMNGRTVIVGGSSYRQTIPEAFPSGMNENTLPLVFWLTHHDVIVPGYEEQGRLKTREIPGVDLVINGHIHRHLEDVTAGRTTWMTPGNISRRSRSDATHQHRPSILRIDVNSDGFTRQIIAVPHQPFDEVFYPEIVDMAVGKGASSFVAGLAELQARRTESGAGLLSFLEKNVQQFESSVANEIMSLAREVTQRG